MHSILSIIFGNYVYYKTKQKKEETSTLKQIIKVYIMVNVRQMKI